MLGRSHPTTRDRGPIALGTSVWIIAGVGALTRPVPVAIMTVMFGLFFLAFYITRRTGSPTGMPVLIAAC